MNNTDKKTDLLISKLRKQKPVLDNGSLLTDNIMAQIRRKNKQGKQSVPLDNVIAQTHTTTNHQARRVFMLIKTLSTVAAIFFLVLYLFQEKYGDKSFTSDNNEIVRAEISKTEPPCLIKEQYTFEEVYSCYLEYTKSKNKQTFINYINKIKNNGYENN
jgi:hypothetical protein